DVCSSDLVDLDRVVALWPELRVCESNLDREGYLIDLGRLGAEILVKSDDVPTRRRFTIAHELGHWILRRSEAPGFADAASHATLERWCDQFAAGLLMPKEWLLRELS